MDLIDRQAAIGIIQSLYPGIPRVPWLRKHWRKRYEPYINAEKMIRTLPSAQPEIIWCKDCKYWREHKYAKETKRYIPFCGFNAIYTKADDFCSRAERREE